MALPVLRHKVPRPRRAWLAAVLVLVLAVRAIGCGESTEPPLPAAIRIEPAQTPALLPGDSYQLTATATDAHGSELSVSFVWRSEDPSVATVNGLGEVTALAAGSTQILASSGDATGKAAVSVLTEIAKLVVSPLSTRLVAGQSAQLIVAAEDVEGHEITGRPVAWEVEDASVATVSPIGLLVAVAPGTTRITVTESKRTATAEVTVLPRIAGVQVMPTSVTLHPGDSFQLHAAVADALGNPLDGRPVAWSISDPGLAKVSTTGLAKALKVGTPFVIAETEGQRDSAQLVIEAPVRSVTVRPDEETLRTGETLQLEVITKDAAGKTLKDRKVAWESSAPEVAKVSVTGLVAAAKAGATSITAKSEGRVGESEITVIDRVASVTIVPASRHMVVGEKIQFVATLRRGDGERLAGRMVRWSIEDDDIASVSSSGLVTARGKGTAVVKASSEGVEGRADVTISRPEDEPIVLIAAGDIAGCDGDGDEATARLLDNIPGTVLTLGDNVYQHGTDQEFADCYDPTWGRHKDRTRPIAGNHEYETPNARGYFNYFGPAAGDPRTGYYSYDLGSWHILALNSQFTGKPGSPQAAWVKADLAAHPKPCTLALWHVPLFGRDSASGRMKNVWQILYDAGADVVLNGHEHNYQRFAPQTAGGAADPERGMREFIVGTGGRGFGGSNSIFPNREAYYKAGFGVLRLSLHRESYDWSFIPVAGTSFSDNGSARCH